MKGEGIRRLLFVLDFGWRSFWIPAFAGMTGDNLSGGATIAYLNLAQTCPCKPFMGEGEGAPRLARLCGRGRPRSQMPLKPLLGES